MNQKHMDKISLKIHKGFRTRERHPHPQPSPPSSALGLSVGNLPPSVGPLMGLLTLWPPSMLPASPLQFFLISCGLVAKGLGWAEGGKVS